MTPNKSTKQDPKRGRSLKVLLSKKPQESWEQFRARVTEEFRRAGLLAKKE
jgi:hypothetical protein